MNQNNFKYFLFSAEQMKQEKQLKEKIGKIFIPTTVMVGGINKQYTEIVDEPSLSRFTDSIIVHKGDIIKDRIIYTKK